MSLMGDRFQHIIRQVRAALQLGKRVGTAPGDQLRMIEGLLGQPEGAELPGLLSRPEQWAQIPEPAWLVDGLIPAEPSLVVLYGESGAFKSFLALDLALAITQAQAFLAPGPGCSANHVMEFRGEQVPVLYLAAEDSAARLKARLLHLARFRGLGAAWIGLDVQVASWSEPIYLSDKRSRERLCRFIETQGYGLVIVDTLAESLRGVSLNWEKEASAVVDWIGEIRSVGASAILVHHTRKPSTGGEPGSFDSTEPDNMRGSSVLRGSADVLLAAAPFGDRELRFRMTKNRAREGPWPDLILTIHPQGQNHGSMFTVARDFQALTTDRKREAAAKLLLVQNAVLEMEREGRLVTADAVARTVDLSKDSARHYLNKAVRAGELRSGFDDSDGRRVQTYRGTVRD